MKSNAVASREESAEGEIGFDEGSKAGEEAMEGNTVRVLVGVDDTDDATRATSTGEIASLVAKEAVSLGGTMRFDVTRHQLLIRDDIPYTSHNSAMVFEVLMPEGLVGVLRKKAVRIIAEKRADTSDPGLCIAAVSDVARESSLDGELVSFGWRAKEEFCSIESAYKLASRIPWLDLSEHGGNGAGVVGALAGVGLRLSGEDGRFRGKWDFAALCGADGVLSAGEVADRLAHALHGPVRVTGPDGSDLMPDVPFRLDHEGKPVLLSGAMTIVCDFEDGIAVPYAKVDLGDIGNGEGRWNRVCDEFEWDNDVEECEGSGRSCRNCLHRKWVSRGFRCMKGERAKRKVG